MNYGLGVDIGGTKIASAIINDNKEIVSRVKMESNKENKEKMFEQVVKSIERVLLKSSLDISAVKGIGIGVPGKIDRKKGVAIYQNNLPWRNFPLEKRIKDYFSIDNILIDNDVYMACLAEWEHFGTERDTFVYLTISTGVSCSIIHHGSFIRGNGFAGEIGLLPFREGSSIKTLENMVSGPAIESIAQKTFDDHQLTTKDFFELYHNGDPLASQMMKDIVNKISQSIYSIICLLDPDQIVIGGGVINNNPDMIHLIKKSLHTYLIPEQYKSLDTLSVSALKDDSGIVGAGLAGLKLSKGLL